MSTLETIFESIPRDPDNAFVAADYLDELGDPRGELLRLVYTLTRGTDLLDRPALESRLQALIRDDARYPGPYQKFWLTDDVSITMSWIPPGSFLMGSPESEDEHNADEIIHPVTLTRGFWFSVYPITQLQWRTVMGTSPGHFQGEHHPVENVSWNDCQEFCKKIGEGFRLPTEAEWEYACCAGTTTAFHSGNGPDALRAVGWFSGNSDKGTKPVGLLLPNGFGLYDMHGNVWEWCQDIYGRYQEGEQRDPFSIGVLPGCTGAAAGTSTPGTAVRQTASGSGRWAGSAPWGFASPEFRRD